MEIQEIKQRLTMAEVIKHYGLKAEKQARLKCPFHNEEPLAFQRRLQLMPDISKK